MLDSRDELLAKITLGEDSVFELKAVRFKGDRVDGPARDDLADDLAAFANSAGGVLLLGVDDRRQEIVGIPIERLDAVETFVRQICLDTIKPPLVMIAIRMLLPGPDGADRAVIKVEVPRGLFPHESAHGYFHRIGSSTRKMEPELLARLFQQRSQSRLIRFDEQAISDATLDDLEPTLYERFRGPRMTDPREGLLHKLAMARLDAEGQWRPTVTGVLMASADPRRWMPNAFIQAVAYQGADSVPDVDGTNYQRAARDITGPLDLQVVEACRFVRDYMTVSATKDVGRQDVPPFDMTTVFEAVVNAVAHRDYQIYGSKIRLRLFSDRLEISSPGSLANTMTVESLPFRQSGRNEAISSLLAKCVVPTDLGWIGTERATMMDRRGEGVSVILERGERHAGRRPAYRMIDDSELLLTIPGKIA